MKDVVMDLVLSSAQGAAGQIAGSRRGFTLETFETILASGFSAISQRLTCFRTRGNEVNWD